jgi:hypothetical protein
MSSTIQEHLDPHTQVIVFVNPYSRGCVIAQEMVHRSYDVMALWTHGFANEMKLHIPLSCAGLECVTEITQIPDQVDATIELLVTRRAIWKLSPVWQEEKLVWILPTSFPNAWDS